MNIFKKIFQSSESHLKCFNDIENVFHETDLKYNLIFFPMCSVNLNQIIPNRNEWVHFVDVWNNGDIEERYFHENRTRGLIRFKLKDSKYFYKGNEIAFPKYDRLGEWNDEALKEFEKNKLEYLEIGDRKDFLKSSRKMIEDEREKKDFDYYLYVDQMLTYLVTKERYKSKGKIYNQKSFPKGYKIKSKEKINQIGGKPQWIQRDMTPTSKEGKPLTFIGDVTGFNYMANGTDKLYLFLDEDNGDIVQIMQYG